uniref:SH2 domain-containing protein n=1 Tax=Panagrellus redivivus TaxID=6233 RepID=A0A7E4VJ62_PANRE
MAPPFPRRQHSLGMGARRRRSRQSDPPQERNRKVDSHCECVNRMPAPTTPTRMAMTRVNGPTDDFVPLASVLEDWTESSEGSEAGSLKDKSVPKAKKICCVHANPCVLASKSCAKSPHRQGDGFIQRRSKDNSCDYYVKNSAKSPTVSEAAFDKIRHDQKSTAQFSYAVKTRWPLTELISELLMNPPTNHSEDSVRATSNHARKTESSSGGSNFYDNIANHDANETNETSGRRKSTKRVVKHAYPKLKGVLEETGYIELRVPKGSRETDERSPRKKNTVWDNLPYADVGYLKNRSITTPPTSSSAVSAGASSPPEVSSEKEFINRASDLELVCRYYIGHKERKAAETAGKFPPDSFFLYHQVPELRSNLDNLKKCIRLFLLYVTPSLRFKHYAIQKFWKDPPSYCVEADPKRSFKSLNELIRFYALNKTIVGRNGQKQRFPGS